MRPVARIAQSVEQGIENPRVLGSIPSPGTTNSENPAYGWVFAFLRPDSSSNCVRLFAAMRLTPSGPARQARCSTPAALVRVRAPLFKEPAQKAGFCFSATGLSIELRSIIRRNAAHPFGASATSALFNVDCKPVGLISAAPSGGMQAEKSPACIDSLSSTQCMISK